MCSRNICFLQSQIRDKELQCTVLNVKPSGLSWLCLAPQLVTTFLSNSLKTLVTRTFTNGFPSVTSVLQHLVFNMFFHDVLFTAPSPLPGGDEKVILIFQRSPVNYSTGLCIAYSLQIFVSKVLSLLFNMLSRLVIAFLPRNKCLLILWLESQIAYDEWCRICDLWRRFSFGTRDQAWSLKSFCVAEFY